MLRRVPVSDMKEALAFGLVLDVARLGRGVVKRASEIMSTPVASFFILHFLLGLMFGAARPRRYPC